MNFLNLNWIGMFKLSTYEFEENWVKCFKKIYFWKISSNFHLGKTKVTNFLLLQLLKV